MGLTPVFSTNPPGGSPSSPFPEGTPAGFADRPDKPGEKTNRCASENQEQFHATKIPSLRSSIPRPLLRVSSRSVIEDAAPKSNGVPPYTRSLFTLNPTTFKLLDLKTCSLLAVCGAVAVGMAALLVTGTQISHGLSPATSAAQSARRSTFSSPRRAVFKATAPPLEPHPPQPQIPTTPPKFPGYIVLPASFGPAKVSSVDELVLSDGNLSRIAICQSATAAMVKIASIETLDPRDGKILRGVFDPRHVEILPAPGQLETLRRKLASAGYTSEPRISGSSRSLIVDIGIFSRQMFEFLWAIQEEVGTSGKAQLMPWQGFDPALAPLDP